MRICIYTVELHIVLTTQYHEFDTLTLFVLLLCTVYTLLLWTLHNYSLLILVLLCSGFQPGGTLVICDTLTKTLWHFDFIFMWHSWSKNIKKMTPRQKKKVERTVVHYWLLTSDYSQHFRTGTLKLRWVPFCWKGWKIVEIPQNL